MTEKEYTNQDVWTMGAENTANLLNKLTKENQKLKDDKNQQKSCGRCKHLQIDGMFGMWCDKGHNWKEITGYCSEWER